MKLFFVIIILTNNMSFTCTRWQSTAVVLVVHTLGVGFVVVGRVCLLSSVHAFSCAAQTREGVHDWLLIVFAYIPHIHTCTRNPTWTGCTYVQPARHTNERSVHILFFSGRGMYEWVVPHHHHHMIYLQINIYSLRTPLIANTAVVVALSLQVTLFERKNFQIKKIYMFVILKNNLNGWRALSNQYISYIMHLHSDECFGERLELFFRGHSSFFFFFSD